MKSFSEVENPEGFSDLRRLEFLGIGVPGEAGPAVLLLGLAAKGFALGPQEGVELGPTTLLDCPALCRAPEIHLPVFPLKAAEGRDDPDRTMVGHAAHFKTSVRASLLATL